jgi:SAM-dependent methyltransferase
MTAYDEVRYPGRAFQDTHPDHLAALGRLFGLLPAAPERCRVLEIACGDGSNLIPMAWALPHSRFLGIDLASRPIERGRQWVEDLGLHNVLLQARDLCEFSDEERSFDYIIVHGLYSWVPEPVREALMRLVARHLAPQGVAFISYNIFPGCHLRRMLWDVLKFHTDGIEDPQARLAEAAALARMLASGRAAEDRHALQEEASGLLKREAAYTFHDDLSPHNEPVYFHQFLEHATAHGLQFLCESEVGKSALAGLSPDVHATVASMDAITREQYLDFLHCRRFRQSLLCHADVTLTRAPGPERLQELLLGMRGQVMVRADQAEAAGADPTEALLLQRVFDVLADARPQALTLRELHAAVSATDPPSSAAEMAEHSLARLTLRAVLNGAVEPHAMRPALVARAGDHPLGSALARRQGQQSEQVTNLVHQSVQLDDPVARRLLALLDGTRSRPRLCAELAEHLTGEPSTHLAQVEAHLRSLGRMGLLAA